MERHSFVKITVLKNRRKVLSKLHIKHYQREMQYHNSRNKFLSFSIVDKFWHRKSIDHCENVIPETRMSTNR